MPDGALCLEPDLCYASAMVPLLMAPMAELSHRALRELVEGFGGCDGYFTEMISAGGLLGGGAWERFYLDAEPCPERVVYQLVGGDAGQMVRAAAVLDALPCAGIDLNMGCSAPAITRTGAGADWMRDPERAAALAGKARAAVKKRRLSVKLRIGYEDDFEYLLRFCRRLEAEGVEMITLHPRTAREKFRRRARREYVERLHRELGIPVAGNGDVSGAADLARWAGSGTCDAVMAGRQAVKEPWLFAAAKLPPGGGFSVDIEETGLRFLDLLERRQPPEFHQSRARRFFAYFCGNLVWGTWLRNRLDRETGLTGMVSLWRNYFHLRPEEKEARIFPESV